MVLGVIFLQRIGPPTSHLSDLSGLASHVPALPSDCSRHLATGSTNPARWAPGPPRPYIRLEDPAGIPAAKLGHTMRDLRLA